MSISKQFAEVFKFIYSYKFLFNINFLCFKIRITITLINIMTDFFATNTTNKFIKFLFLLLFIAISFVFILVFLALMFLKFTTLLIFSCLSAAPPNFTPKFRLMNPARPIEVLFFMKLFSTIATHLYS